MTFIHNEVTANFEQETPKKSPLESYESNNTRPLREPQTARNTVLARKDLISIYDFILILVSYVTVSG